MAGGADCNIRNMNGYSALDCAVSRGQVHVIKAVVAHGSDVNTLAIVSTATRRFTRLLLLPTRRIPSTPFLVEAGADIELKGNKGETPRALSAEGVCYS